MDDVLGVAEDAAAKLARERLTEGRPEIDCLTELGPAREIDDDDEDAAGVNVDGPA